MSLKRYLFALTLYYPTFALSAQWFERSGYLFEEARALAHVLTALLYVVMSLYLVVLNPPKPFAFDSTPRRIMRWLLYLALYYGLVLMPAELLLHAGSRLFYLTLAGPALFFLGMLHASGRARDQEREDRAEVRYPRPPLARGLYYALFYFIVFTGLAAGLKGPFDDMGVPNPYRPILFSMMLAVPYLFMTLVLTVIRPSKPFDYASRSSRLGRFLTYVGLFMLLSIVLPFFPANLGSDYSWLAGIVPLCLFLFMVQPAKAQVRLPSVPKTADSRWRGLKYAMAFLAVQMIPAGILLAAWFFPKAGYKPEALTVGMFTSILLYASLVFIALLYRLVVTRPHSRFQDMPRRIRYRRWLSYVSAHVLLQIVGPMAIAQFWQWDLQSSVQTVLSFVLLQAAAYGSDAVPGKKRTAPPPPPQETRDERLERRLREVQTSYPLPSGR